ncbi:tail fiber assembly protein [Enterobacter hormaechei]|uniref:tail fiber assembly protein n=1 Tax=Enterobacter hormaechei TaxID=158836 RepID=UPI00123A3471|nr:tail fiber assembly protein [Enterobacter hormaechei]MCA7863234.1 tail fiber assembly protein [Escherichia coli]VAF37432.1 phage tail assembly chaperone gp38 [Enterobacter hormaechei]
MKKYFYDVLTNAFYPIALKDIYELNGMNFDNAQEVDEKLFIEYSGEPPKGKIRIASEDGFPAWGDIPPPTHDELIAAAEAQKRLQIDHANKHMNSKQWPGKAAMGHLKDDEKAQYNAWLDYLDALEAIDTSTAPDITWPNSPI